MSRSRNYLMFLMLLTAEVSAQITPKDSSILNYRLVGFSFPKSDKNSVFGLEIANGNFDREEAFKKNIILSFNLNTNNTIAEVPSFGTDYTWRVISYGPQKKISISPFHHFKTGMIPAVDSSKMRLRILKKATAYNDACIFLDANKTLYDMNGNALWFLPESKDLNKDNVAPRDIKITSQHTITLLKGEECFEINYNGNILWHAPNPEKEHYHHEFTRLKNGHYMLIGGDEVRVYLPENISLSKKGMMVLNANDPKAIKDPAGYKFFRIGQFAKVMEYDQNSKLIWTYHSIDYFNNSDLSYNLGKDGLPDIAIHDNAFFFDEQQKELFISARDISRIIKVKYPSGKTITSFGPLFTQGARQNKGAGLFCNQHNCRVSSEGYLYLFNNNACKWPDLPTVVMMTQPKTEEDSVEKVWEYKCTIDDMSEEEQKKLKLWSGGSVEELPDKSFLVNMGGQYSKVFIVNRNKEILWSAMPEVWSEEQNKWMPCSQYRASMITNYEDLKKLIWNQ